jgi:hypothetical protein
MQKLKNKNGQGYIVMGIIILIMLGIIGFLIYYSFGNDIYFDCLGQKYCQEIGLNFSSTNSQNMIFCQTQIKGFSMKLEQFKILNLTILKNRYKDCKDG